MVFRSPIQHYCLRFGNHAACSSVLLFGAGNRNRTYDLIITNDALYQLSYPGAGRDFKALAGVGQFNFVVLMQNKVLHVTRKRPTTLALLEAACGRRINPLTPDAIPWAGQRRYFPVRHRARSRCRHPAPEAWLLHPAPALPAPMHRQSHRYSCGQPATRA